MMMPIEDVAKVGELASRITEINHWPWREGPTIGLEVKDDICIKFAGLEDWFTFDEVDKALEYGKALAEVADAYRKKIYDARMRVQAFITIIREEELVFLTDNQAGELEETLMGFVNKFAPEVKAPKGDWHEEL